MARAHHPVKCRNCGYVTTPVSGFCPQCLERLPPGDRRVAFLPLALIAGALLVAVLASVSGARFGGVPPVANEPSPRASVGAAPEATGATPQATVAAAGTPLPSATPQTGSAAPAATPTGVPTPSAVLPSTATDREPPGRGTAGVPLRY